MSQFQVQLTALGLQVKTYFDSIEEKPNAVIVGQTKRGNSSFIYGVMDFR